MADNRTVYQQAFEGFTGDHSPIITPHGLTPWALVEKFYNGLTYETQARFDTAAGGNLMDKKSVVECNELFESFARSEFAKKPRNGNSSPATNTPSSVRGVHQVNLDTSVAAALESLASEIKNLKAKIDKCELCRGGHGTSDCPLMSQEQDQSFSGDQSSQGGSNGPDLCNKLDEMMQQIITRDQVTQKTLAEHDLLLKNQQSAMLDMQRTIGDIARILDKRPPGQFSGSTQQNPVAQINAISTRSGRVLGPEREIEVEESDELVDEEIVLETPGRVQPRLDPASTAPTSESIVRGSEEKKPRDVRPSPLIDHYHMPYPARVKNQKFSREYGNFLDMFRQLRINLPFIEALQHMPKYAKFLKDILKRKESLKELSTVPLNGECSAIVLNKVPEKLPDPGVFTVPCSFGRDTSCQALADLGARVNLMPYSLFEKLGLGELTPTCKITLRAGDDSVTYVAKSMRHPSGQSDLIDPCHPVYAIESFVPGMDPRLDHPRSVRVCLEEEREVASSRESMEFDRERGGGKRKFVEFGKIVDEWSYCDAVS
ncbi:uncharacterized protein LOC143632135 [Bidens hawaiensis]|uniref:uncharacterized protein LOC143632135 n=1 Tax=Bidens hawaiensis TaxID=980011 RepID=UPI00404B7DD3